MMNPLDTVEETQLLEELIRCFRSLRTKAEVLEMLDNNSNSNLLHRIPLLTSCNTLATVSLDQAKKDFSREKVLFNDVPFIPDSEDQSRSQAFLFTLKILLQRMHRTTYIQSPEEVCELIMQRACADSFFMVQTLLCSHEDEETTFVSQKTLRADPPLRIDVFVSPTDCSLWSRAVVRNCFCVFDTSVLEEIAGRDCDPPPWLEVEAIVVDESNFSTGQHWRNLQLLVSCPVSGQLFPRNNKRRSSRLLLLPDLTSCFSSVKLNSNNNNNKTSAGEESTTTPPFFFTPS